MNGGSDQRSDHGELFGATNGVSEPMKMIMCLYMFIYFWDWDVFIVLRLVVTYTVATISI